MSSPNHDLSKVDSMQPTLDSRQKKSSSFHDHVPDFHELPSVEGMPKGCTWGGWDKNGEKDVLGTLNLLTKEAVAAAYSEVKRGITVSLNWCMTKPNGPALFRKQIDQTIIPHDTLVPGYAGLDDQLTFNSQCSSQWDGLRHHAHIASQKFYNNIDKSTLLDPEQKILGVQAWNERGGIVGRGVLIDYVAYAERHNIKYSPVEWHNITPQAIEEAAKEQGVEFKRGDMLIIRSGFTAWYNSQTDAEARDKTTSQGHTYTGVTCTEESIAWVWNKHFAAVAGDAPTWESLPPQESGLLFHDYLIALFGMPIGEFWDLEKLAQTCAELKQYSFLLTSSPLNVPGGVASPPNALALF